MPGAHKKNRRHACRRLLVVNQQSLSAGGLDLIGMQDQLLDAPIEDFGREYHVFGRAGHLVDPAELLELLAGFAEHTEHLAVERELVNPSRMGIGGVENLEAGLEPPRRRSMIDFRGADGR